MKEKTEQQVASNLHTLNAFNSLCSLILTATEETQIAEALCASLLGLIGTQHKTHIDLLPVPSARPPSPLPQESTRELGTPEGEPNETTLGACTLPPQALGFGHLSAQAAANRSIVEEFIEESTTSANKRKVVSFVPVASEHLNAETPVRHVIMVTREARTHSRANSTDSRATATLGASCSFSARFSDILPLRECVSPENLSCMKEMAFLALNEIQKKREVRDRVGRQMQTLSSSNERMQRRIAFGDRWEEAHRALKRAACFEEVEEEVEALCKRLFPGLCEGAKLFLVSRKSQDHLVTGGRCAPAPAGIAELDVSEGESPAPKEEEAQNSISLFSANAGPAGAACTGFSSCLLYTSDAADE